MNNTIPPSRCFSRLGLALVWAMVLVAQAPAAGDSTEPGPLDPLGKIHIPIGIPNTLDSLKTFFEDDGSFSPGVGTYGVSFWVYDRGAGKLILPRRDAESLHRGFVRQSVPTVGWAAAMAQFGEMLAEVRRPSPVGDVYVVSSYVLITPVGSPRRPLSLYAALRPLGPAGGDVEVLSVSPGGDALLVDGRAALVSNRRPDAAGVLPTDTIGELMLEGKTPTAREAVSPTGDCSGALRFDIAPTSGGRVHFGFICSVLPGRRAVRHKWDGVSEWAQLDLAAPNPSDGGVLQPNPGLEYYRKLDARVVQGEWRQYWKEFFSGSGVALPDEWRAWQQSFDILVAHAALSMNEGAPDVAVVNYNVFNRDGVYVANILQKSGKFDLAAECIEYFLKHPFNGRIYPEADNPGQILWVMGEHWLFTRDRDWLERVYPGAQKLAAMIRYYRTTPGPHWVNCNSLDFGDALAADERQELKPGRCDGHHPEYTEAFDLAGLRGAVILAGAMGREEDAKTWDELADSLLEKYDEKFGSNLAKGYGSYSVLWPCRLYPFSEGKAHNRFKDIGPQKPAGWRYFPLARAHQSLLAGNREAGWKTLNVHLEHEQMKGWYAFDEGGRSGPGGWHHLRTTWNPNVAMPHGWATAEVWLLMRDCLVYEDGDRLVLLAGVPQDWFRHREAAADPNGFSFDLPTHFGRCRFVYEPGDNDTASLRIEGDTSPPGGFVVRLPQSLEVHLSVDGREIEGGEDGAFLLPTNARIAKISFDPDQ